MFLAASSYSPLLYQKFAQAVYSLTTVSSILLLYLGNVFHLALCFIALLHLIFPFIHVERPYLMRPSPVIDVPACEPYKYPGNMGYSVNDSFTHCEYRNTLVKGWWEGVVKKGDVQGVVGRAGLTSGRESKLEECILVK